MVKGTQGQSYRFSFNLSLIAKARKQKICSQKRTQFNKYHDKIMDGHYNNVIY